MGWGFFSAKGASGVIVDDSYCFEDAHGIEAPDGLFFQ